MSLLSPPGVPGIPGPWQVLTKLVRCERSQGEEEGPVMRESHRETLMGPEGHGRWGVTGDREAEGREAERASRRDTEGIAA